MLLLTDIVLLKASAGEDSELYSYERLCRTSNKIPSSSPKLICRLTVPHPYFLIGPMREEVMQADPLIVVWHDFVTANEVEEILEIAKPRVSLLPKLLFGLKCQNSLIISISCTRSPICWLRHYFSDKCSQRTE